ncbi:9904_t:CDS:2, partial [Paraglomus occultum]
MDFDSAHDSDSQPLSDAVTGNSESNTEYTDNSRPDVATSRARQIIANTNPVRRASFAPSRLSAVFDPNVISTWWNAVGGQQDTTKAQRRATVIDYNSVKTGLGTIRGDISLLASDVVDEDLDSIFASFLVDLGLPEHARMKMMSMPDDQKRLILHSNEQAQAFRQQRLDRQQEQIQNQSSFGLSSSESNTDDLTSPKDAQLNQSAMTGESSHNNDADPNTKSSHRLSGGSWSSVESTSPTSSQPTNVQEERPLSPTSSSVARGFLKYWFGSLTSSTKSQDTPEYYIGELTQRNTQQVLANRLTSLRVTLSHVKMAWIRSFLDLNGLSVLEAILEKLTDLNKNRAAKRSDHDDKIQTECIRCLRVLMNTEPGFGRVIQSPSLISCIVFSLSTRNHKLRAQVADVLAALCVLSLEGHRLVLNALSDFRNIHEEKYRFEHL